MSISLRPVASGSVKFATWEKVYENTLTDAAASIDITGLTGNTDEMYLLDMRYLTDGANLYLRFNSDAGTNYGYQLLTAENASFCCARNVGSACQLNTAAMTAGRPSHVRALVYAKSGNIRQLLIEQGSDHNGTTIDLVGLNGHTWNNTADEITSINLVGSGGNLAAGTRVSLYRKAFAT